MDSRSIFGQVKLYGDSYPFVLNGNRLYICSSNWEDIQKFFGKKLEQTIIEGVCFPNRENIIFILSSHFLETTGKLWVGVEIKATVDSYVKFDDEAVDISGISIEAEELNYIYDVRNIIEERSNFGEDTLSLKTKTFNETISASEKGKIHYQDGDMRDVEFHFCITGKSYHDSHTPFVFNSVMRAEFPKTQDAMFIRYLALLFRQMFSYLCFRKDIYLRTITLRQEKEPGNFRKVGEFVFLNQEDSNCSSIENDKRKRCIPVPIMEGALGSLLQMISNNQIFVNHIPDNVNARNTKTISSTILLAAAFDWEFEKLYPDGVAHNTKKEEAREKAAEILSDMAKNNKREIGEIFKRLKDRINDDSMSSRLKHCCRELDDIFSLIARNRVADYTPAKFGDHLQSARNSFVHGKIDREITTEAVNEICLLERLIFVMQLKRLGLDNQKILQAIGALYQIVIA